MVNEAQNAKIYVSKARCTRCGTDLRYVSTWRCVECAARYRQQLRDEKARRRERLRPLKGTVERKRRLAAIRADKVTRDFARAAQELMFQSRLRCKNGHENPVRYVSSGGCVTCQKLNAKAQYARLAAKRAAAVK